MPQQESDKNSKYNPYDEKINKIIMSWYYESGIIEVYRKTDFDLYKIYCFTIIPKSREIIQLTLDIEAIDNNIDIKDEAITRTITQCKALEARLSPWERLAAKFYYFSDWNKPRSNHRSTQRDSFNSKVEDESPKIKSDRANNQKSKENKYAKQGQKQHKIQTNNWLYFGNKIFDWILKAGLGFVVFLSLFEIITLINESDNVKISLLFSYFLCGFSAIALVWLSSATIYNAVLANSKQDNIYKYPHDDIFLNPSNNNLNTDIWWKNISWGVYRVYLWMILIGGLEFFIGKGLIFLIDKNLTQQNINNNSTALSSIVGLTNNSPMGLDETQKFAITCSIAIFAVVNILYAYYRGKNDHKNKQLRHDTAFLLEKSMRLEQQKKELELRRSEKEKRIEKLQKEIDMIDMYPHDYIHRRDVSLGNDEDREIPEKKN